MIISNYLIITANHTTNLFLEIDSKIIEISNKFNIPYSEIKKELNNRYTLSTGSRIGILDQIYHEIARDGKMLTKTF